MRKIIFLLCILSLFEMSKGQNGTPDLSFGNNGAILTPSPITANLSSTFPRQCFIEPDGKLLFVLQTNKTKLTRRFTTGNIDLSYGNSGYSFVVSMYTIAAAMQGDGKIVVAGMTDGTTDFMLSRYNTDGTVDASFGNKGVVITDIGSSTDFLNAIVITPEGKIIVGGSANLNGHNQSVLVQYTATGLPDATFGNNGMIITDLGGAYSAIFSLAVQPDGKIVAAGTAGTNDGDFALARYNEDGSPDLSFNGTGMVTSNFGMSDGVKSVLINSDGKIYAGGITTDASGFWHFLIARYNSNGSPDLSFNAGSGFVSPAFGNSYEVLSNIRLQSNGKIIAAGTNLNSPSDIELTRINTDGTVDKSFGNSGNGFVIADINSGDDEGDLLIIQSDDKILTGGTNSNFAGPNPAYLFSCFRFNADGSPDTDFGAQGNFSDFVPGSFYNYTALVQQSDGKLLAFSEATGSEGNNKQFISRFNTNGSADNTYGQNGTQEINFFNSLGFFQPDGKLLRIGYSNAGNGDIMLLRSGLDGTPDASFGNGGTVISDFGGNESPATVAFQTDGKIVIGGSNRDNNGSDFLIARYNPDGSVDGSFGNGGLVKLDFENEDATGSIAIGPDGKIVFAGASIFFPPDFSSFSEDALIVRLNPDGSFDAGFGDQGKVIVDRSTYDYSGIVQVQHDNKIVFTYFASSGISPVQHVFMERLNADGSADNNFGQGGKVTCDGAIMLLQEDQKILILGNNINAQNNADFTLARFNTDGTPDMSFGINGKTTSSFTHLDNFLFYPLSSGTNLFAGGSGVDQTGLNVGMIAKFDLGNVESSSTITCPASQTVNTDNNSCAATVNNIDPTVTPVGTTVNYTLTGATTGTGSGSVSGKSFNKGVTTVTYTLSNDATKSCSFTVTVQDKQLPVINNLSVSQTTLWPPDHKLKDVTVNYTTTDNCGIANTQISVSSDEPVQSRDKDDQSPDWQILDSHHIRLRAERLENGNGRTYSIKVTATDVSGNKNTSIVTVKVPRSISNPHSNLTVTASPNPSHNYFIIAINSNSRDKINARLLNNRGNVLATINNITAPETLKIGDRLTAGIYFLETTQSSITKTIKLIKQ